MAAASEVSSLELTLTQTDIADPQGEKCGFCGTPSEIEGLCAECPLLERQKQEDDERKAKEEKKEESDP